MFLWSFFFFAGILLLQTLGWHGIECAIHHQWDMRYTNAATDTLGAICCKHNAASPWANQINSPTDDPQHNSNCDYAFDQVHCSIAATISTLYVA